MARDKTHPPNMLRHSIIALVLVGLASAMVLRPWEQTNLQGQVIESRAEIAVEHAAPFTLSLVFNTDTKPALLDLSHESENPVKISLPLTWTLREVRGATMNSIAPEEPSAGFVRYTVPPGATLALLLPQTPSTLLLRNIPPAPHMSVRWKKVNLAAGTVEQNVTLINGEGGKVW